MNGPVSYTHLLYKSKLIKKDGTAYYVDKNGVRVENKVVTKKGKTYYFGADGKALTGMRLSLIHI